MNLILARSTYIQDHKVQVSDISDPHTTILLVMQELNKNLRKITDQESRPAKLRTQFTNAFTAIYILQTSLDFARGGEIAENLFRLYEYCRQQLLKAFARNPDHSLANCIVLLDEIIQAWEGIGQGAGGKST
ncbi:flagellar export chaperone FliS [Roseicyclus sp.]|uniref:flagellar export chaperone FliS n=1 Tax=Roseicyclus sp. TaxID=1914329 RepID=UPI003F6A9963